MVFRTSKWFRPVPIGAAPVLVLGFPCASSSRSREFVQAVDPNSIPVRAPESLFSEDPPFRRLRQICKREFDAGSRVSPPWWPSARVQVSRTSELFSVSYGLPGAEIFGIWVFLAPFRPLRKICRSDFDAGSRTCPSGWSSARVQVSRDSL